MGTQIQTKHGYDLFVVSSALQKAIRRNEPRLAGWAIVELVDSGFTSYAWKRLLVISAEDCDGIITGEIEALMRAQLLMEKQAKKKPAGMIFFAKATLLLCTHPKNRDADHAIFLAREGLLATDEDILAAVQEAQREGPGKIPEYVYDVHTRQGRMRGKTKAQFWREEQDGLKPRQAGLFDSLLEEALSRKQGDHQS